ncbi:MAG TPA: hypothetical protein VK184_26085 [Nostocaceae cyanobacterium]|nr:hypothetical protein [Nostocaceae cyanobacterium]
MKSIINVTGLKPEQIEYIQAIIEAFQAKNRLDNIYFNKEKLITDVQENPEISEIFFASEILLPFNLSML